MGAIRNDDNIPNPKLAALSNFTQSIVVNRGRESEKLENFLDARYEEEHLLGIIIQLELTNH
ncbi:hypothetical protein LQ318_12300 [Aliifodinibius salicampi]|uniref:Uncharacterized protein n=1 Tax=Fodinibius salicampi TaxID=1920655 RepID=A0ABT3Q0P0_9BACT|nr:hypothetical protein [Fodinibius salicampi]MCW9713684.1 hypothetical protein [Fodinibius salicampi]